MEDILDVYQRPFDPRRPLVAIDEVPKQLVGEARAPLPAAPGQPARYDYKYVRNGTANLFMVFQPLTGWRHVEVTERRTAVDFAELLRWLAEEVHAQAEKVVLVVDNLNTHTPACLYEAFEPERARQIAAKLEWHYRPKHGSWLNVAEVELSVVGRRLRERVGGAEELERQLAAIERERNDTAKGADWHVGQARVKLKRLYPSFEER